MIAHATQGCSEMTRWSFSMSVTSSQHLADAVVRFSDQSGAVEAAFEAVSEGNATVIAKLAPTSLLFGLWDSRKTGLVPSTREIECADNHSDDDTDRKNWIDL